MIENGEMKCFNEKLGFLKDLPTKFSIESGQEINLGTNIYPINCALDSPPKLYQYQVNVNPEPENIKTTTSLIYSILFPDGGPEWDSLVYLDKDNTIISSHDNLAKNEISHINKQGTDYEIQISLLKEILLKDDFSDFNKVANTVVYRCFTKLDFSSLDDNFINNRDYKDVDHLRLVGGFHPKIDFFSNGLCLVLDTASRIDRKGTLYDILISGVGNTSRRPAIEDSLSKMSYVTRHLTHQRTVKIHKVRWNSKAQTEPYNNTNTTISEHFTSQYNFVAKPDDPIVDVISIGKIESLPASALSQVGITEVECADSRLMSAFHDALFLEPVNLKQKLDSIVLNIKNDISILKNFGLSIGDSLTVKGHILDPPQLIARSKESNHNIIYPSRNNRMEFDVSNVYCAVSSHINSIPLIISPESLESQVRDIFLDRFMRISTSIGLSFKYPQLLFVNNFNYTTIKNEIFNNIRKIGVPSFIIFICSEKNQQRYDSLNQLLISNLGIPSQFILADSIFNRRMGVDDEIINIAYQLTAKTGGIPYYVPLPLRSTLIIGVASYKNETESSKQITVCISASIDQTCARFYSDTFLLDANESIPENVIKRFVKNAKEKYRDMVRKIPTGLIVYRLLNKQDQDNKKDTSDEILKIAKTELCFFKDAFNSQCSFEKGITNDQPKSFVFITVQENSTVRLFTHNDDKVENPRPGTIVFDPESGLADFYLISNYTQFGTAMPVRYIILNNVNQQIWTDERIAQLTYYLCFNCCSFPGALKLPSPLTNSMNIATFSHQRLNDLPLSNILKQKIVNFV